MHFAILQFAPVLGELERNIAQADDLLEQADTKGLDLLVLPEMAFTGYNFPSLSAITPYLEPTAAGPTARWAARTAARLGCLVSVGYPETTNDPTAIPSFLSRTATDTDAARAQFSSPQASRKNYNSTVTVTPTGSVVAHYRKTHLYYTDYTWASPSPTGFLTTRLPFLSFRTVKFPDDGKPLPQINTAFAICMDLNPDRFIAPWHAYELASHVLFTEATLLIASNAWLTRLDRDQLFGKEDREVPDWDTLGYWAERLKPLSEADTETLVIISNRVGVEAGEVRACDLDAGDGTQAADEGKKEAVEALDGAGPVAELESMAPSVGIVADEARYAGSSCIMKLGRGKVQIWGVAGRGEERLLRVDTMTDPIGLLVVRSKTTHESDSGEGDDDGKALA